MNWSYVLNATMWTLFATTCVVSGMHIWDRNGRRKIAALWWVSAVFAYLTAATWVASAFHGPTGLSRFIQNYQWVRTGLFSAAVYLTVTTKRKETLATVVRMTALRDEVRRHAQVG